jgi:outer membrane protein
MALQRDPILQSAAAQRAAAVEVRPQALSQLLPQLTATGSAARERVGAQSATGLPSATQPINCSLSQDNQTESCYGNTRGYNLTLSQPILSYEAYERLKEASRQAAGAEATLIGAKQALLLRVAQAYFAILASSDRLESARAQRAAFSTLLEQATNREQTGVGPRSDVEQARSFYDTTAESVIDAQNALDDAYLAMTEIVGTRVTSIAPLQEDIPLTPPDPASVEDWVVAARRDNPAVHAAELKVEAADYDISVQRGKAFPVVSLNGSKSHLWQDPVLGGNQTLDSVNLALSWPLFQSGAVASAVRQSRALYRQANADYETTLRQTETQTRTAYRGVVTGILRITAARRAVASARDAVEATKQNVEFATGSEFELLNAQVLYSNAVTAYSQTRYDYLTSLLTLKQQSGTFAERDLIVTDGMLVNKGNGS